MNTYLFRFYESARERTKLVKFSTFYDCKNENSNRERLMKHRDRKGQGKNRQIDILRFGSLGHWLDLERQIEREKEREIERERYRDTV